MRAGPSMNYFIFAVAVSLLILVHELGHLWMAGRAGIPVARFSVGLGPRLFGLRRRGTDYCVSAVPIGGYVLPELPDEEAYLRIPIGRRILFALGGPAANIVLAVVVFTGLNAATGRWSLMGLLVEPWAQMMAACEAICAGFGQLFTGRAELTGVLGIAVEGGRLAGARPLAALQLLGLLSVNLAVINLLPLPPLDGGKILIAGLEAIHRPLARLHMPVAMIGWALLIVLTIYATVHDVGRCFTISLLS
jgi:regulator of sigma E protease